ncbi:MAG: hypothetical protein LUG84_09295 [Akkermansiaceae bacterium]|nr:hypothetical protein [Akkermansiaceae bacterium]MCD8071222.1 hypothetical protein [Akkermansiaceae bacterium]
MKDFPFIAKCPIAALLLCCALSPGQEEWASEGGEEAVEEMDDMDFAPTGQERLRERVGGKIPALFQDDEVYSDTQEHMLSELGINNYTAPSIRKIFEQLEGLPPVPEEKALRERPEKLPTDRCSLGLEMGFLLADGFIAVQCGKMNDIKPIALDLSRFGKAMGVGDKVNAHAASLLENAEKGQLAEFKENLAVTQNDVNAELASLRDAEIAHIIALGGWIRALDASCAALNASFSPEQARSVFYPDAPEYFDEILGCVSPEMGRRRDIKRIRQLLQSLVSEMSLEENESPTKEKLESIYRTTEELVREATDEKK